VARARCTDSRREKGRASRARGAARIHPMPAGRPSLLTPALVAELAERIERGEPLGTAARRSAPRRGRCAAGARPAARSCRRSPSKAVWNSASRSPSSGHRRPSSRTGRRSRRGWKRTRPGSRSISRRTAKAVGLTASHSFSNLRRQQGQVCGWLVGEPSRQVQARQDLGT
jgi:hypothetical protein